MAWLTLPFANVILTPSCFKKKINQKKHIKFDGYKELAYLHPNYFKPDPSVLGELGLGKDDKFILMRFVSWSASHDTGQHGISQKMRAEYLSKLKQYGKVFIVSEGELGKELEKYELKIAPEKFHSLLSYAQLYIGEGGSTATEAATLGTPSIHISSTAKFCGVFDDLHNNYNLIYTFSDDRQALEKTLDILEDHESKKKLAQRRNKMLKEKIDVTAFMIDFIENYPDSFYELKEKGQGG
jgi:predicted glycosyltransferase